MLLEELLLNPQFTFANGVWAPNVLDEFMRQREFIMPYLEGQNEDIVSAAAAYLTLGGRDYLFWLREAIGGDIDYSGYSNTAGWHLAAHRSADGSRFSNLEQWQWVLETHGYPPMSLELAQTFVDVALDPALPPDDWTPPSDVEGEPECGCWNDAYIPMDNISFQGNVEAHVIDPGGCDDIPVSGTAAVHLGLSAQSLDSCPKR